MKINNYYIQNEILIKKSSKDSIVQTQINAIIKQIHNLKNSIKVDNKEDIQKEIDNCYKILDSLQANCLNEDNELNKLFWIFGGKNSRNEYMVTCVPDNENDPIFQNFYNSLDELSQDFISLREILQKGKYVGKKFKRTKPYYDKEFNCEDDSYFKADVECYILYIYNESIIAYKNCKFFILDNKYLLDGNYILDDMVMKEFSNPTIIYEKIKNQNPYNKGRGF